MAWPRSRVGFRSQKLGSPWKHLSPILLTGEKRGLGSVNMKVPSNSNSQDSGPSDKGYLPSVAWGQGPEMETGGSKGERRWAW